MVPVLGWKVEEGEQRFAILPQAGSSPSMKAARPVPTYLYRRIDNIAVAHARFAQAKHELGGRTDESILEQGELWRVFFMSFTCNEQ